MLPDRIFAEDSDGAGIHVKQSAHGADRRGLAGAVRADQPEHLTAVHGKRHVAERRDPRGPRHAWFGWWGGGGAEALHDVGEFNGGH